MRIIDFRSDTVTKPTEKMRLAMMHAEVGDDVYQDDPTINELELLAANVTGFEDALFVVSGTMGNQLAIMTHTNRGDEIIVGKEHHVVNHEVGAMAVLSNVNVRVINKTVIDCDSVIASIRSDNIHNPKTSLLCLENALSNGQVIDQISFRKLIDCAHNHNLMVHVDGARIFNAALALNTSVDQLVHGADSMMFCLSKGLGAPIGSMLVGSKDFIKRARKYRKMIGGGWRQAGIIASCGIIAIKEMVVRLHEDHDNAKALAFYLNDKNITVFNNQLDINMVYFSFNTEVNHHDFVARAKENGFILNPPSNNVYRLVTHLNISSQDVKSLSDFVLKYAQDNQNLKQ